MASFKIESRTAKQEATSAGALLIVLGLAAALLVSPLIGGVMAVLGLGALVAGKFASS